MQAVVFHGAARGLEFEERPVPEPGPGEALVRVVACGVCHTDLHYLDHGVPTAKPPPLVLGHEASGTVEALGPGAAGLSIGQAVLVPAVIACGTCEACGAGRANLCAAMEMFGNHRDGAFAEFVTCPAHELVPLPTDVPLAEAALLSDGVTTAYWAVRRRGGVGVGDTVAVFGCGGVGLAAVQVACAAGARVIAVDLNPERLALARTLGASDAIPADAPGGAGKALRKLTGGGVDVAFEVVGVDAALRAACDAVRPGGRVVLVGYNAHDVALPVHRVMFRELELVGSLGCPRAVFPRVVALVRRGAVRLAPLVSARLPLGSIPLALDRLRRGEGVRTLLLPRMPAPPDGANS
jgi:threonine dehydrogenase-like Zn-dependent dehydrogenase